MEKGCSILGVLELELGELVASMEIGWGFRVQPKASVSKFDLGGSILGWGEQNWGEGGMGYSRGDERRRRQTPRRHQHISGAASGAQAAQSQGLRGNLDIMLLAPQ